MAILYRHLKQDGEVFYIGIGKEESRAYDTNKRSKFWKSLVGKNEIEIQILKKDLTWKEACELEKILIHYYGRRDIKTGTLVNMTDGGEGSTGRINNIVHTEERKNKMRQSRIEASEKNVKYICTKTLKTFGSISLCSEYLNISVQVLLKYVSSDDPTRNTSSLMLYEDYLLNGASEILKPIKPNIKCIDTLTLEVYDNIVQASKALNIAKGSFSSMVSKGGMRNTTYVIRLSDYCGEIHYPEVKLSKQGKTIIEKTTREEYRSLLYLSRVLGINESTLRNKIINNKINYEYK